MCLDGGRLAVADTANNRILLWDGMPGGPIAKGADGTDGGTPYRGADYVLALKGNQGTLREDVELFAAEQKANGFSDTKITRHKTVDGDHGRIETREVTVIHDVEWLRERHDWPGLKSVVVVESTRELGGKIDRRSVTVDEQSQVTCHQHHDVLRVLI